MPWGRGELDLALPGDWPVFLAEPAPPPPPGRSPAELLDAALCGPLKAPPLAQQARKVAAKPGARVAIVVDDDTRPTPARRVLPVVLGHLGAGERIGDDQIEIHFAGGMHAPMGRAAMAAKIGPDLLARFACFNNPWQDPSQYRYLGRSRHNTPLHLSARVADADLRVLIGSVNAHLQAGFSGGLKLLFPGLSSLETIKKLHLHGTEDFRQLIGLQARANPMRREIDRLAEFLDGDTFNVQLLLDGAGGVLAASAGEPVASQRAIAAQAVRRFGVPLPGQADVLVANSFPLEHDLWQGFKCIANTLFAARPGGLIVALLKADHGAGGMKLPAWSLSARWIRRLLRLTGRDGLLHVLARVSPQVNDEARFFVRFCLGTIRRNDVLIYSPSLAGEGVRFPGLEVHDNLHTVWARARELLGPGGGSPNVTVFGHGGVCYPLHESPPA